MYTTEYNLDSMTWIEGTDVFNSAMLLSLRDLKRSEFIVRKDADRIDLVCVQVYGSADYRLMSLLVLLNGKTSFKSNEKIYYIETNQLNFVG